MKILEELQARLARKNLSEVSRRAGMSYSSVHMIASGKQHDLRISTYTTLNAVLNVMDDEAEEAAR